MSAESLTLPNPAAHGHDGSDWRRRVARAFSRAAPRYTELACAQQSMGEVLWQRLPRQAASILDLGCGPGHWTARLTRRYGVIAAGLDLAPGMLAEARRRHGHQGQWLCADATALPIANHSIDLVFSNLAIQWCRDPTAVFSELARVLTSGGRALINTLGPGTLGEIATAWAQPGHPAAVERFADAHALRKAAHQAGLRLSLEATTECFHYADFSAVMDSVKGVGAQVSRGGPPLTRGDCRRAARRYERLREPAGLPVSYRRLTLELTR